MIEFNELLIFSVVVIAGLSLLLFLISIISYSRLREIKLLFISLSFLIFGIKDILFVYIRDERIILMDLIIIVFLYLAAIKK